MNYIPSYLNSINYILDQQFLIDELEILKNDFEKKEKYIAAGIKYHYKTEKTASELAYWVLLNFLEQYPSIKKDIDVILFTTDNLDASDEIDVVTINSLLSELGLSNAFPIFQGYSNCANICTSFYTACAMVESGRAKNVLVVSVDKLGEGHSYLMNPEMSVLSDAGICLWISSTPVSNALKVGEIFKKNNPEQWIINRELNYQAYSTNKLNIYLYISKNIKNNIEGEINHFIMNNYFKHINEMFLGIMRISPNIVDFSNVGRVGHAPAGDVFINLFDLMKSEKISFGQNIALVADSPSLCMGIILRKEQV